MPLRAGKSANQKAPRALIAGFLLILFDFATALYQQITGQSAIIPFWLKQSPVRHPAKRRCIKTLIQELKYLAARLIRSGHRLKLRFSQVCPGFIAFESTYTKLAVG